MNLLVTGGAGYIGSHTAWQLEEAGHKVVILDNFYSGNRWAVAKNAKLIEGEVSNVELLESLFRDHRFDAVLHFAAHIEVAESVIDPLKYYRNNVASTVTLLSAMQKAKIPKLIFSSTAAVYGETASGKAVAETDPKNPVNAYGTSKMMVERMIEDLARAQKDFRYTILRYFNVAGARLDLQLGQGNPRATHLVKCACDAVLGRRPNLTVYGNDYATPDGTCLRDYIHVEDLATAHLDALKYLEKGGASDTFNVGYGRPISVLGMAQTMKHVSGMDFSVVVGPRRVGDPASVSADNTKIRRELGWTPKHENLETICRTALEWEKHLLAMSADSTEGKKA